VSRPEGASDGGGLAPPAEEHEIVARHSALGLRALFISGLTLLSRVLGYGREVISAALFGDSSTVYDAFVTAWRIPNLFRRLLGEGALSTALQNAITEEDHGRGAAAGSALFQRTIRSAVLILFGVCAVVIGSALVAPDTMPGTGWHWLGEDPAAVRELVVRLMPYVILVCVTALIGGALQVRGEFRVSILTAAVLNVIWILALVAIAGHFGWDSLEGAASEHGRQLAMVRVLGWCILAAGAAQILVQVPALKAHGLIGAPAATVEGPIRSGWSVVHESAPLAVGAAAYQVNILVDGLMAQGLLAPGGPSAYYFANRIQQLPLALFAVAIANAVYPRFKALGHLGRSEELRGLHDRAQLGASFFLLPACAGLFVLGEPIASALFEHGAYGPEGVRRMASALRWLALALPPAGAVLIVTRAYYGMGDLRTPVRVAVAMVAVNIALNAWFTAGIGMDTAGLSLATAITTWLTLFCLLPGLNRGLGLEASPRGMTGRLLRQVICALASAVGAWSGHAYLLERGDVIALMGGIGLGLVAFASMAALLRVEEARTAIHRARERFMRRP